MNVKGETSGRVGLSHSRRQWLISLGLLAALTLAMFADVLFASGDLVLSDRSNDLFSLFVHWRRFGFEQLRQGNLALWNPHVYSGAPFFGGFHAALLYPPNAIFLLLPLQAAINWGIALHVFLAGAFTYAWLARRRLHPLACFLAAVMFMFGGAFFLHIYAGHLPHLCAMVWSPLIFLAIDGLLEAPSLNGMLLGALAVTMQILAGFPQYVFYTAIAAGVFTLAGLPSAPHRQRTVLGLAGMALFAVGLSAVQLFTSFNESLETLRSVGLNFQEAAMFSFPPENFLTLLAPDVFGGFKLPGYWGRCYLWEMSLFVSVTGAVMAAAGVFGEQSPLRRRVLVSLAAVAVLALGKYTPAYQWLFNWVPGFDSFRGMSKFMMLASLFLALLAGIGLDGLLRRGQIGARWAMMVGGVGLLAVCAAVWVWHSGSVGQVDGGWHQLMLRARDSGEGYLPSAAYVDPLFIRDTARLAARELVSAGVICLVLGGLFWRTRFTHRLAAALVSLAVLELFVFARGSLTTFDLKQASLPEMKQFLAEYPGDYRILDADYSYMNGTMTLGASGLWGYEPNIPMRYAQFIAFTQGLRPDQATQYVDFTHGQRLYQMLRCRFLFLPEPGGKVGVTEQAGALPHVLLVQHFRVMTNCDRILAAMNKPDFDPSREVILETTPDPAPVPSADAGTVRLVGESTDWLDIEADVKSPSILLITDSYAKGWRAHALPGSVSIQYKLLPANWCLRAVPLAAGHHRLRVEYMPAGFAAGKWVSLTALMFFLALAGLSWRQQFTASLPLPADPPLPH